MPIADRPRIPGGYLAEKRLAWPWAESRLVASRNYWIATASPTGRPRSRPVWGVWRDERLYFSSGSLIRRDLEADPRVCVNLESGDECVIVEGRVEAVKDAELARAVSEEYARKYHWDLEPEQEEFFAVVPEVAFGWLCDGSGLDAGALYSQTATRWRFGETS